MTAQKFVGLQLVQSPGREFGDKKKMFILYLEEESTLSMGFKKLWPAMDRIQAM